MGFFLGAALCAAALSYAIARVLIPALRASGFVDIPHAGRKIHAKPVVLGAGLAIACTVALGLAVSAAWFPAFVPELDIHKWVSLASATAILFAIGLIDDRYNLPAAAQLIGPVLASILVIQSGIVVSKITNPFGGLLFLDATWWLAPLLTFCWLMGIMYSTKLLDGLDGLSTGLSGIAALMIFALTQLPKFYEPRIGFAAIIFAGACLGFLVVNFFPARAFLGEGGSLFLGFALGILAILSGSKIATALLVMGLPLFDVARVMIVRLIRRQRVFGGDQLHLHHLLLRNGFSHRTAVLIYYTLGLVFGLTGLLLQSMGKALLLGALFLLGLILSTALHIRIKKI